MNLDYKTKQELNALSKEVFGSSSRWQKLVNSGFADLVTEEVEEVVPADENGEKGGVELVQKPVLNASGLTQSVTTRHTVESVRELMLRLKASRDAYFARLKALQEARKAEEEQAALAKKLNDQVGGSAAV